MVWGIRCRSDHAGHGAALAVLAAVPLVASAAALRSDLPLDSGGRHLGIALLVGAVSCAAGLVLLVTRPDTVGTEPIERTVPWTSPPRSSLTAAATQRWPTAGPGAAVSSCRWCRSGSGRTSAATVRSRRQRAILRRAFDLGITHFDLANNYGPPYGAAEENVGRLLAEDFGRHRDELIISTKAGWDMWPGPYGDRGSRKYVLASLDQSLRRLGVDYVDIFYSPPPRSAHAARGDDGRAAHRRAAGQGALRRDLFVRTRADPAGRGHPAWARHAGC